MALFTSPAEVTLHFIVFMKIFDSAYPVADTVNQPLQIELISLGNISPFSTTSLVFVAPAMESTLKKNSSGNIRCIPQL